MATDQVVAQAKTWVEILLALLDWPFLLFTLLLFFAYFFKDKVGGLLERGDIQISWGENKHIKLKDLSDGIDKEIDPLKEEIQELKEKIFELQSSFIRTGNINQSQEAIIEQDAARKEEAEKRIIDGLRNQQYRWRSIERLSTISGVSINETLDILRSNPDVVLSMGKSKKQIARLKDR